MAFGDRDGGASGGGEASADAVKRDAEMDVSSFEAWVRIELSKPRRLSEIRIGCTAGPHATPRECVLEATCGAETFGVFIEVGRFELPPPSADAEAWTSYGCYRPYKSKQYRLVVTSWHPPAAAATGTTGTADASSSVACELSHLHLLEAELEVDALQLLHMTHNRALNLSYASSSAGSAGGSSQSDLGNVKEAPPGVAGLITSPALPKELADDPVLALRRQADETEPAPFRTRGGSPGRSHTAGNP